MTGEMSLCRVTVLPDVLPRTALADLVLTGKAGLTLGGRYWVRTSDLFGVNEVSLNLHAGQTLNLLVETGQARTAEDREHPRKARPCSPCSRPEVNLMSRASRIPLADRIWSRIQKRGPDECWPWLGTQNGRGYGIHSIGLGGGKTTTIRPHRFVYEQMVGPISPGLEIDHICHSWNPSCVAGDRCPHRSCCNPFHLRAVTPEVNRGRINTEGQRKNWQTLKTECPAGHAYTPENIKLGSHGERKCRKCHNEWERKRAERKRAQRLGAVTEVAS